jgi:hypothetical protein
MRTFLVIAILPALAGCAVPSQWARTDGGSVDQAQRQATLAQCKGEAATARANVDVYERINVDVKVTESCMARNGYILSRGN